MGVIYDLIYYIIYIIFVTYYIIISLTLNFIFSLSLKEICDLIFDFFFSLYNLFIHDVFIVFRAFGQFYHYSFFSSDLNFFGAYYKYYLKLLSELDVYLTYKTAKSFFKFKYYFSYLKLFCRFYFDFLFFYLFLLLPQYFVGIIMMFIDLFKIPNFFLFFLYSIKLYFFNLKFYSIYLYLYCLNIIYYFILNLYMFILITMKKIFLFNFFYYVYYKNILLKLLKLKKSLIIIQKKFFNYLTGEIKKKELDEELLRIRLYERNQRIYGELEERERMNKENE